MQRPASRQRPAPGERRPAIRPDRDSPAGAPAARSARVALAAEPDPAERVDAVPGPPCAAGAAVISMARAVRAVGLVGEDAATAAAGPRVVGAREPGGGHHLGRLVVVVRLENRDDPLVLEPSEEVP